MNNRLPNFLIVGAAKAATTSVHEYLKQHPDIYMTDIKEPCFFTFYNEDPPSFSNGGRVKFTHNQHDYDKLFKGSELKKIKGESSTPYLFFHKKTINNIKKIVPNYRKIKILIILRNPVDRAYSQYTMKVRDVVENLSFEEAIKREDERRKDNAHFDFFYLSRGFYYEQVKDYLENFDNVKIMFYDDFKNNRERFLSDILLFLGLNRIKFYPIEKQNVSGIPKLKWLNSLIFSRSIIGTAISIFLSTKLKRRLKNKVVNFNIRTPPKMNSDTRSMVVNSYKKDIKKLEKLIDKDLSYWHE